MYRLFIFLVLDYYEGIDTQQKYSIDSLWLFYLSKVFGQKLYAFFYQI